MLFLGYTLLGRGIPLHTGFKEAVRRLAKGNPATNIDGLNNFVDEYGTHYINKWVVVALEHMQRSELSTVWP